MSKISSGLTVFVSVAGALSVAAYLLFSKGGDANAIDIEKKCSLQKLLSILEELQIQYTPYYIHYYHLIVALNQENRDKPAICAALKEKIAEKLEQKTTEILEQVAEKFLLDTNQLAQIIQYYSLISEEVRSLNRLFQANLTGLFSEPTPVQPDFQLRIPEKLTKKVYINVLQKIFAVIRHQIYKQIRHILRQRKAASSEKYITKNEMKNLLAELDVKKIRSDVFELYSLKYDERALMKAYYSFMIDQKLVQVVRQIKQSHERFMTAILSCDVFPGLEKTDPLSSPDEDVVPEKFGPKWYEHTERPKPKIFSELLKNADEPLNQIQIDTLLQDDDVKIENDSQLVEI